MKNKNVNFNFSIIAFSSFECTWAQQHIQTSLHPLHNKLAFPLHRTHSSHILLEMNKASILSYIPYRTCLQ